MNGAILIAEDHEVARKSIQQYLQQEGYRVQDVADGNAAIEDVANMLHMHPRTLQRRLTTEGTTFEKVRDDVRRRMAEIYLANEVVPLAHVAHLLGYANQSVLTRSCLRWFGKTPLAMRQQVTGRGR